MSMAIVIHMLMKFHSYTDTQLQAFGWISFICSFYCRHICNITYIDMQLQVFLAVMTMFLSVDPFHFYPRRYGPITKIMDMVDNKEKEDVVCSFILMANHLRQLQFVTLF